MDTLINLIKQAKSKKIIVTKNTETKQYIINQINIYTNLTEIKKLTFYAFNFDTKEKLIISNYNEKIWNLERIYQSQDLIINTTIQ